MSVLNALPTRAESETPRPLRVEWHAIGIIALCIFLIIPILGILFGSMAPSEGSWDHLVSTVLWDYVLNTLGLLLIVAVPLVLALSFGLMRPGKGLMIALQIRDRNHGAAPHA